jgi:hypothetical protein
MGHNKSPRADFVQRHAAAVSKAGIAAAITLFTAIAVFLLPDTLNQVHDAQTSHRLHPLFRSQLNGDTTNNMLRVGAVSNPGLKGVLMNARASLSARVCGQPAIDGSVLTVDNASLHPTPKLRKIVEQMDVKTCCNLANAVVSCWGMCGGRCTVHDLEGNELVSRSRNQHCLMSAGMHTSIAHVWKGHQLTNGMLRTWRLVARTWISLPTLTRDPTMTASPLHGASITRKVRSLLQV